MRSILIQYEDSFRGDLLLVTPNHPLPYAADIQALVPAIPGQSKILLQAKAAESLQQVFRH